jgi:hypothetical protein
MTYVHTTGKVHVPLHQQPRPATTSSSLTTTAKIALHLALQLHHAAQPISSILVCPENISIQAMHHVMTPEAAKIATSSQWSRQIINIEEPCFSIVHPVTKQTIT